MDSTWILAADSSQARIFITFKGEDALYELDTLKHPGACLMNHPLDEAQMFAQQSAGDIDVAPRVAGWEPSKRQEAIGFARQIANHLEYARSQGKFHRLVIIAAPEFLSMIRDCMTGLTAKLVVQEIDKNLTCKTPIQIHKQLPRHVTTPLI